MKLHYLYSDHKQVLAATIRLNGEKLKNALYVDDENQYVIRRMPDGTQKRFEGRVTIDIPAVGKKPNYSTPKVEDHAV